jgi:nitrite reductase (NADH) large subunit
MSKRRLVVVGNGMGGARFVEELVSRGGRQLFEIAIYGEEALLPSNRSEVLFPLIGGAPGPPVPAADLPDTAQICDCNAVSKGRIVEAVRAGARGLRAIRDRTRASTGCGSCTPEVQKIVDFACGVLPYVGVGTLGHGRA